MGLELLVGRIDGLPDGIKEGSWDGSVDRVGVAVVGFGDRLEGRRSLHTRIEDQDKAQLQSYLIQIVSASTQLSLPFQL